MSVLDAISPTEVGERLRIARENVKFTQAEAAAKLNLARTTLTAIEQGQRNVRLPELQELAKLYGTSVNALLRQEALHVDLAPRFRKLGGSTEHADEAIKLLAALARAEAELENLLGVKRTFNLPPERPLMSGDVLVQAEDNALELRHRLGLGLNPISDIISLLEFEMGVRVYARRLDAKICGLFAYDDALGPCILLNSNHPRDRQTGTATHECGHMVSSRRNPEILHSDEKASTREERYANAFQKAFLMPRLSVAHKFREVTAGSDRMTRRHVILLAHFFRVSREALVRRLEELRMVKPGTWDWFSSNGGITNEQVIQVLGDFAVVESGEGERNCASMLRLTMLAGEAYRREILSEGQLARMLHLHRIELREMLRGLELGGAEPEEASNIID
jgi:Zn-dependent peptidase ImmA (M78 family)/DNA-binding XRE family transcriptional regulator